jgi:hypothetical protein
LKIVQRWGGGIHMNRWRVGEDRGSKETDGCPLTIFAPLLHSCITYHFFICNAPYKILKRATDVIILSFSLLLSL